MLVLGTSLVLSGLTLPKLPYLGTITKDCVLMVSFSNVNGEHIKTHKNTHLNILG